MTTPVTQDDIVAGAVTWLMSKPDVTSAVSMVEIDGKLVPALYQYRIWQTNIEGTGNTACVIDHDGGWAGPNTYNTLRFPRLVCNIWADPIRDDIQNTTDFGEVRRRANVVFQAVDRHLHRPGGPDLMWGGVRVISSVRLTEPNIYAVPDGDGLVRLQAYYAIVQG